MAKKYHVKLDSKTQKDKTISISFNYGFGGGDDDEEESEPNYEPMVNTFRNSIGQYFIDIEERVQERNEEIELSSHIDYIEIIFQDQFNIEKFYQSYYNEFGIEAVNFSKFNTEVLFAVIDFEKFETFLQDIQNFILKESGEDEDAEYRGKITFVRSFQLLTSNKIINYQENSELMNFSLVEFPLEIDEFSEIYDSLNKYLNENGLSNRLIPESNVLEIYGASTEIVEEIIKNFDILLSVTSSLSTVVSPTELNTINRGYGFEINNPDEELPIIGILDTGISNVTPLTSILIDDLTLNITSSSSFIDNANDGYGHGTSVAALAALGRKPYEVDYRGKIDADAKLLSMKILDSNSGALSYFDVLGLLNKAKENYPEIKLFVLTTCYDVNKAKNESHSPYAYELDKFAHKNDCLIFICTANNNSASNQPNYNLEYFLEDETNLCSPSDSMNNLVVGAAADNLSNGVFVGISHSKEYPTIYTRKSHIDLSELYPVNKQNKNLFRPDVIESGGDYEEAHGFIGTKEDALLNVLSADPTNGFYKEAGTSYSTPLVANIAAQILKTYPKLKSQTIKSLILNSASLDKIPFDKPLLKLRNKIVGHGIVNSEQSFLSNSNSVTFIIEDEILPEEMKIIPLNFPSYLTTEDLGKKNGILYLTATLCFSFEPVRNNHLSYCPLNMAFAIFRNQSGDDILKTENVDKGGIKSKLKESWSQNNRWKSKPIPASNTQKIGFPINVKDLNDENSTFKLAIHCLVNSQLLIKEKHLKSHSFSMAITIEEKLPVARQTGKLYDEMLAVNQVENIVSIDGEADIELEN